MSARPVLAASIALVAVSAAAHAGPTARFGLTYAAHDPEATSVELGPMIALGLRSGAFVGEAEWGYLSFLDPDASTAGVHRVGVTLRADLWQSREYVCWHRFACTRGRGLYVEAGAAERFGRWRVDAFGQRPARDPQPEVHVGVGLELDNRLVPDRSGWQLGLRLAFAPGDPVVMTTCRGNCPVDVSRGGIQKAVLLEWMFLIGR
jgi:hypothetical protein